MSYMRKGVPMLRKAIFLAIALCAAAYGAAGGRPSSTAEKVRVVRDIPYAPESGKFGLGDCAWNTCRR